VSGLAVPTPYQWSVGDTITAALLNAQLYNGLTYVLNPPIFFGYQTVAQTLSSGITTPITLDSQFVDTYGGHSTTSNTSRYVGQVPGYYEVTGSVAFAANTTDMRSAAIFKNGAQSQGAGQEVHAAVPTGSHSMILQCTTLVYLNGTTDYVEVWGFQSSGAGLATYVNPNIYSSLYVRWVHA
jgi:hypothetical protein